MREQIVQSFEIYPSNLPDLISAPYRRVIFGFEGRQLPVSALNMDFPSLSIENEIK